LVSSPTAIQTTGNVTIAPYNAGTTIGIASASGTLSLGSALLNTITAGSITIGRSDGTGALAANAYSWAAPARLLTGSGGIAINGTQSMGARSFLANTASGNISFGASGSITSSAAGNAIVLASGGDFINNNGSAALSTPSGRWLVYSTTPVNDFDNGLRNAFRHFSCAYGSCQNIPGAGSGLLYSYTLTLPDYIYDRLITLGRQSPIQQLDPSTGSAYPEPNFLPNYEQLLTILGMESDSDPAVMNTGV